MPKPVQRFIPSSQVLCQTVAGEAVLLDLRSEQYFGLDEIGARIWDLLGQHHGDLEKIEEVLIAEYDAAPEAIARDLRELMQKLIDAGLVVTHETPATKAP